MPDYGRNLWTSSKTTQIVLDNPEMIILRSMHKKQPLSFKVNKAVLCYYSGYFQALINGPFMEGQEEMTELNVDISQKVLRQFYGWLTTGSVQMGFCADIMVKLWIFGDYIDSLALRRAAISHLQQSLILGPNPGIIDYRTLHENKVWTEFQRSALYRYIVHTYAFHWDHRMDYPMKSPLAEFEIPKEFFYDQKTVMSIHRHDFIVGFSGVECFCCHNVCRYHEHSSGEEYLATCGSLQEDLLEKFWDDDASDIDGRTEDNQDDGNDDSEESDEEDSDSDSDSDSGSHTDSDGHTESNIEGDEEMETIGKKRKAQDEDDDGSTKKLKQDIGS